MENKRIKGIVEMENEKWRMKNDNEEIKKASKHSLLNNRCWPDDKHYFKGFPF